MTRINISSLLLVCGKRLINDQITEEGRSRIEALVNHLKAANNVDNIAIGFAGGVQPGQNKAEAQEYSLEFKRQCAKNNLSWNENQMLFDLHSSNTIQNIKNMIKAIRDSELLTISGNLEIKLVSTEYHIFRITQIQKCMEAQGLIKLMRNEGEELNLKLIVHDSKDEHICAAYPFENQSLGKIYQHIDKLTIYRVYLEGIKENKFSEEEINNLFRTLSEEAKECIEKIREVAQKNLIINRSKESILSAVETLEHLIMSTNPNKTTFRNQLQNDLALYHAILTALNKYVDPDSV